MKRHGIVAAIALLLLLPNSVFAQATTDNLYVDLAVPDLPALSALGLDPSKISQPGNLKELSVSVFPLFGGANTIGPGVAVAWAPVYTFAKSVDDYRKPVLRRLAFSFVTSKEADSDAVNAGVGVRVMLIDRSDPVLASKKGLCTDPDRAADYECQVLKVLESNDGPTRRSQPFMKNVSGPVMQAIAALMTPNPTTQAEIQNDLQPVWDIRKGPALFSALGQRTRFNRALADEAKKKSVPVPALGALDAKLDEISEAYIKEAVNVGSAMDVPLTKIREAFEESHWNALVANVDFGIVGQSATGEWSDLEGQKYGGSLTAAFPIGASSQVVVQIEGRHGVKEDASETSHVGGGGRWLVGSSTKRFSAEAFVADTKDADAEKDGRSHRFTVGSEFRVTKGFWLEVAFGSDKTPGASGSQLLSLANFKYAFKSSPRFEQIPGSVED